jgi:diguanylate cyclase (GGDEF)-like protein/PAS domain S-box-containing protein
MSQSLKKELDYLIQQDKTIWSTIKNHLVDGFLYVDADDPTHFWASSNFWNVLGYDPESEEVKGKNWVDHLFNEDFIMMKQRLHTLESLNDKSEHELRFHHKNGSTIWISCRSILIRDENGKPHRILSLHTNITQLKDVQNALKKVTHEYEMVFEGTQDVIFLIKVNEDSFTYVRANHALVQKTGISLEGIIGKSPISLLGPEAGMQLYIYYQRCVSLRDIVSFEFDFDLPHGKGVWFTTLTPIVLEGNVEYIVGSSMDISDRKNLENQLIRLANHDSLTGLSNRRYFLTQIDSLVQKNQLFTILFCDLDGFKGINDVYGHDIGDELLIQASQRLKRCIVENGMVSRFGGDEFTLILNGLLSELEISEIKARITAIIEEPFYINDIVCMISVSIGHSQFPQDGDSSRELIKIADQAMYQIKKK